MPFPFPNPARQLVQSTTNSSLSLSTSSSTARLDWAWMLWGPLLGLDRGLIVGLESGRSMMRALHAMILRGTAVPPCIAEDDKQCSVALFTSFLFFTNS